jgi:PAS domain S-box-containing protein
MLWDWSGRPTWKRYLVAMLAVALATVLRAQLLEVLGGRVLYLTYYPAVMVAALYGGFRPGLLATVVAALAAMLWWEKQDTTHFVIAHGVDFLAMAVFIMACGMISYLAESTRRAQARASDAQSQSAIAAERAQVAVALRESEERLRLALSAADMGVFEWNVAADQALWENDRIYEIFGHTRDDGALSKAEFYADYLHPDDAAAFELALDEAAQPGRLLETVCRIRRKDDSQWRWVEFLGRFDMSTDGTPIRLISVIRDVTERKRIEGVIRVRLDLLEYAISHSLDELLQKTLDEVGILTGSPIGFYHFVESDQENLSLRVWSTPTVEEFCKAEGKGMHYPIAQAGVWVDCVHQKRPVIHNDFNALPHRKGMPDGHAPVIRELVVPIMRSDRVEAILGVGNKPTDYTQEDVELVSYLADVAWEISMRKRAEEEREQALSLAERRNTETEAVFSAIQDAVLIYDTDMRVQRVNAMFIPTYGFDPVGLKVQDLIEHTRCRWLDGRPFRIEEQPTPRALRGETVRNQRFLITRPDGVEMALETSSGPLRVGENVIGSVTVWHDITERIRAEEALRESREDLNRAQAVAETGSWRLDVRQNVLLWSDENHRIFGVPKGTAMTYQTFLGTIHPDDRQYVHEKWLAALRGEPYDIEHRIVVRDSVKWLRERAELEFDENRELLGGFGTTQDITKRKLAEAALRHSEASFKLLSETAGWLLTSVDPQGIINELCRRVMTHLDCHAFFNFLADEPSRRLHLNACAGIPDEETRKIEWLDYGGAVCGCAARDQVVIVAEDILNVPDLRTELVKSYGIQAYACHPLIIGDRLIGTLSFGTKTRTRFSSQDLAVMKTVTDQIAVAMERMRLVKELQKSRDELEMRVKARTEELAEANRILETSEEKLRNNNELLQKIVDGITDPLIMLDKEGLLKLINTAAKDYYGITETMGVLGKPCNAGLRVRETPCPECEYPFQFVATETVTFERKGLYDSRRAESITLYPILDKSGQRDAIIIRINDVTEAKLLERQILQNEKLASLGLLTSGIAHEINNPNSFIYFNIPILNKYLQELMPIVDEYAALHPDLEVLHMSYRDLREDIFRLLENMEHGSQRINNIVGVLKSFVRKRDSHGMQKVDLRQLIDKVVALCHAEMKRTVKSFELSIPADLPEIMTDPEPLEQVLLNLLINAIHACDKPESRVSLKVEQGCRGTDGFTIEITDNGSGIEEAIRDKIFDPFFTTKPSPLGTGLGLYICHNHVEFLGGTIEMESTFGQGSTFRVLLPPNGPNGDQYLSHGDS